MKYLQVFLVASVLLLLPWFIWFMKADKPMSVMIVNKASNEAGLYWMLNHMKITTKEGDQYKTIVNKTATSNESIAASDRTSSFEKADFI